MFVTRNSASARVEKAIPVQASREFKRNERAVCACLLMELINPPGEAMPNNTEFGPRESSIRSTSAVSTGILNIERADIGQEFAREDGN